MDDLEKAIRVVVKASETYNPGGFEMVCDEASYYLSSERDAAEQWQEAIVDGIKHARAEAEATAAGLTVIRIATKSHVLVHVVDPETMPNDERNRVIDGVVTALLPVADRRSSKCR